MKLSSLMLGLAGCGIAAVSAPSQAAITFSFAPGAASPSAGYALINTFNTSAGITGSGFEIKTPPADDNGAPPANSVPAGTSYLSVLGGGSATINFATPVSSFQFDWGSIDSFNKLTVRSNTNDVIVPGSNFTNTPANGNQVAPGTNGLFTLSSNAGELFTSVTFESSGNSFEVDNLAVAAVPEPGTWAMMIGGFGAVGGTLRRRKSIKKIALA